MNRRQRKQRQHAYIMAMRRARKLERRFVQSFARRAEYVGYQVGIDLALRKDISVKFEVEPLLRTQPRP